MKTSTKHSLLVHAWVTLALLLLGAAAPVLHAATANVNITFTFDDAALQAPTATLRLEPRTPPWSAGGSVVLGDPIIRTSKTSPIVVTNLFGTDNTNTAVYRVVLTTRSTNIFWIKNWLTNANADSLTIAAPGQSQAWAAGYFVRGVAQGTNIITTTNSGNVVTVHGTSVPTDLSVTNSIVSRFTNYVTTQSGKATNLTASGLSGGVPLTISPPVGNTNTLLINSTGGVASLWFDSSSNLFGPRQIWMPTRDALSTHVAVTISESDIGPGSKQDVIFGMAYNPFINSVRAMTNEPTWGFAFENDYDANGNFTSRKYEYYISFDNTNRTSGAVAQSLRPLNVVVDRVDGTSLVQFQADTVYFSAPSNLFNVALMTTNALKMQGFPVVQVQNNVAILQGENFVSNNVVNVVKVTTNNSIALGYDPSPVGIGTVGSEWQFVGPNGITNVTDSFYLKSANGLTGAGLHLKGAGTGSSDFWLLSTEASNGTGTNHFLVHQNTDNRTLLDFDGSANGHLSLSPAGNGAVLLKGPVSLGVTGAGSTNTSYKLNIKTGTDNHVGFRQTSGNAQLVGHNDSDGAYAGVSVDASVFVVNAASGGKMGVGTLSPLQNLHVVGSVFITNGAVMVQASTVAPAAPPANTMGAALWTDGTNWCSVFRNGTGTLSTNKLSMTAWP